jgi:outer membrane receptor protein involved in Fe transport
LKTKKIVVSRALLSAGAAPLALCLFSASPAMAQDADAAAGTAEGGESIVVTGSRITRTDLLSASPVQVITAEEFAQSGAVNVEEVLYDLPQVIPSFSAASNNPGDGSAQVDLRGLGAARTLVLVNGRRYIPYDTSQVVDLNTIPSALIESVDVVTGGRSAVYGADAIAGVVNFRLKTDFEGVVASSEYRITEAGDGGTFNTNVAIGGNFADGRGNVTVFADYTKRKSIFQGARSFSRQTISDDDEGGFYYGGSGTTPDGRLSVGGVDLNGDGTLDLPAVSGQFNPDGSIRPITTADAYNFAPANYLQVPQERWMAHASAHYEVSPHFDLFTELTFINNRVNTELATSPASGFPIEIQLASPFLADSTRALLTPYDIDGDGYVTANASKRPLEVGSRSSRNDRNAYRILFGSRGEIAGNWTYEGYYSYARTQNNEQQSGNIAISRFQAAVKTQFDADGNLVCVSDIEGCVPANIFGAGNLSPEAANFIAIPTQNTTVIESQVAQFTVVNNNLFDFGLGAAPVGVVLGAEWRSEKGRFSPDFYLASGDVVGFNAGQQTVGGYKVRDFFGELSVPVVADQPFMHRLEFNGAIRHSHYNNSVGDALSWSAGGQWAPIEDLTFRGQFQRAIRAPTVAALFGGQSVGFPAFQDYCSTAAAVTNANLRASCIANGVPAALLGTDLQGGSSQIRAVYGGNPDLKEETSDTYTFGAVLQPSFAPGLSLTVDYYNIKLKDAILVSGPGATSVRDACFGTPDNGFTPFDTSFCSLIPRNPQTYEVQDLLNTALNAGSIKTEGVDFELRYSSRLDFGFFDNESRLSVRVSGTRLIKYANNNLAAIPSLLVNCEGRFGAFCGDPFSKWRGSARVTWATGPVTLSALARYIGRATDDGQSGYSALFKPALGDRKYYDLSIGYEASDNFNLTIGVDNIANSKPPLIGDANNQQANTFPSTYDVYGRRWFTNATLKF